ncbi:MAG: hypothetical protein ABIA67_04985 [Candidatus Margulisiibacteriota bacterium]
MKKIIATVIIGLFVIVGSSYAKAGDFQAGGVFGAFNGEGISTTYGGPVIHYGITNELDIAGRYETGSYSGATLTFLTVGLNYYFRSVTKATRPYITLGASQIWGNFIGGADSMTGYFYGGGLNYRLTEQFLFNFDFRAHAGNYAGWELNATTLSIGLMMDL